jgi:hypothetical protein
MQQSKGEEQAANGKARRREGREGQTEGGKYRERGAAPDVHCVHAQLLRVLHVAKEDLVVDHRTHGAIVSCTASLWPKVLHRVEVREIACVAVWSATLTPVLLHSMQMLLNCAMTILPRLMLLQHYGPTATSACVCAMHGAIWLCTKH